MHASTHDQAIAIAIAKNRNNKKISRDEPKTVAGLAVELTVASLSSLFMAGLIFSSGALICLTVVSIRGMIALW